MTRKTKGAPERPTPPAELSADERFFFEHDGYSRKPEETELQALVRCARASADAERRAREVGLTFAWEIDQDTDSSDFSDDSDPWALWQCVMRDAEGAVVGSLGGVDFGRGGEPWGEPYRRCVEASLAAEHLDREPTPAPSAAELAATAALALRIRDGATVTDLRGMTQALWDSLTPAERYRIRDTGMLSPQLLGKEGCRVEVQDTPGAKPRRFIVGMSTGWQPIHLELRNVTSRGGSGASREYASVKTIARVR